MRTILLILGLSCVCLSADWKYLYSDDSSKYYFDESSLEILPEGNVKVWLEVRCKKDGPDLITISTDDLCKKADSLRHFYFPPLDAMLKNDSISAIGTIMFEISEKYRLRTKTEESGISLLEINLKEKMWRRIAIYPGTMTNGQWRYIVPETVIELLYKIIIFENLQ